MYFLTIPKKLAKFIFLRNVYVNSCSRKLCSANISKSGPLYVLQSKINDKLLEPDDHQLRVAEKLQELYEELHNTNYEPVAQSNGLLSTIFGKSRNKQQPKGLYIYGTVGTGKTLLLDMFYDCCKIEKKQRIHFHSFMTRVHKEIHQVKTEFSLTRDPDIKSGSPFDPIKPVADIISEESWLICFDEFQVTDIADAMILKRLFTYLFENGIVMISTSNRQPDDLYKNGLQRSNFIPFIPILKHYCNLVPLDSGKDYRTLSKGKMSRYFLTSEPDTDAKIDTIFKVLCSNENDYVRGRTFTHFGRNLTFDKTCGRVLDSTFDELCDRPLGSSDYIQVSQHFHTIIIRNIPQLNLKLKSQTRRFITMMDTLYDNRNRVVISSDVPLKYLFSDVKPADYTDSDDHRVLMDDLKIDKNSDGVTANVFTGEEEIFAFDRTKSRLFEMQTEQYWNQWTTHHTPFAKEQ